MILLFRCSWYFWVVLVDSVILVVWVVVVVLVALVFLVVLVVFGCLAGFDYLGDFG